MIVDLIARYAGTPTAAVWLEDLPNRKLLWHGTAYGTIEPTDDLLTEVQFVLSRFNPADITITQTWQERLETR